MKTTRRQELRTNELSQQIEQIRGSLKDNATTITVVGVVVAALAFGGYWYYGQHSSRLENAYSQLGLLAPGDDPADRIRRLQDVAKEQINPALTVSAWGRVGDLALSLLTAPPIPAAEAAPPPAREELIPTAEEAYSNVIAQAADDPLARGHAMIAMGILDENRQQFVSARRWYEKVLADEGLKDLPFQGEAEFRLAGLATWSKASDFPAPPPMVLVTPEAQSVTLGDLVTTAPAILPQATSMPAVIPTTTQAAATESQASSSPPSADSPAPVTAPPQPTPTTQPASGG